MICCKHYHSDFLMYWFAIDTVCVCVCVCVCVRESFMNGLHVPF